MRREEEKEEGIGKRRRRKWRKRYKNKEGKKI